MSEWIYRSDISHQDQCNMHIACEQVIWPSTLPQLVLMLCPSVVQEMHLSLLFPRKEVGLLLRKPHKNIRNIWAIFFFQWYTAGRVNNWQRCIWEFWIAIFKVIEIEKPMLKLRSPDIVLESLHHNWSKWTFNKLNRRIPFGLFLTLICLTMIGSSRSTYFAILTDIKRN